MQTLNLTQLEKQLKKALKVMDKAENEWGKSDSNWERGDCDVRAAALDAAEANVARIAGLISELTGEPVNFFAI